MKVTWLGQGGFLFETDKLKIIIDPYLSDSVKNIQPHNYRRVPVDENFLNIKPNVIVLTHNHLDHTDPETLCNYLSNDSSVTVLASHNAWQSVRTEFGGIYNNYVSFNVGTTWTEGDVVFKAVYAEHSDDKAIGVIICYNGKNYYVTGDTLYNEKVFESITDKIDYVFMAVNGKGNNMNFCDGVKFAKRLNAKAIPVHCGLFDDLNVNEFDYENKVIPEFFKEIKL